MRPLKSDLNNNQGPSINFTAIYKGTLVTLIASLFLSIIAGLIFYLTNLSENTLPWVASAILCISVFAGSFFSASKVGFKGLYHGLGVGLLYFILVWIIAGLFLPSAIALGGFVSKLLLTLISGAVGGILGVSFSS
jgi:putative membrane protein (TIGR04086 family)